MVASVAASVAASAPRSPASPIAAILSPPASLIAESRLAAVSALFCRHQSSRRQLSPALRRQLSRGQFFIAASRSKPLAAPPRCRTPPRAASASSPPAPCVSLQHQPSASAFLAVASLRQLFRSQSRSQPAASSPPAGRLVTADAPPLLCADASMSTAPQRQHTAVAGRLSPALLGSCGLSERFECSQAKPRAPSLTATARAAPRLYLHTPRTGGIAIHVAVPCVRNHVTTGCHLEKRKGGCISFAMRAAHQATPYTELSNSSSFALSPLGGPGGPGRRPPGKVGTNEKDTPALRPTAGSSGQSFAPEGA